jgi:hypothetical protein
MSDLVPFGCGHGGAAIGTGCLGDEALLTNTKQPSHECCGGGIDDGGPLAEQPWACLAMLLIHLTEICAKAGRKLL